MELKKLFYRLFLLLGFTFCMALYLPAQQTNISQQLIQLIHQAEANYPKLKESRAYVKLSEAQKQMATALYMPVIGGEASYRYGQPTPSIAFPINGQLEEFSLFPANNYDFHLAVSQPIYDFGRTQAQVQKTKSGILSAQDNVEHATTLLAYQVTQTYYGIVFLNKSIEIEQQQINLLDSNEKLIRARWQNGTALKYDLLSTQVKKNIAANKLIDLQTTRQKQYEALNMLIGDSTYDYITSMQVDETAFNTDAVNPDNNYEVKLLQDKMSEADWDVKIAKRGWLPSLSANASVGYKNGFVPEINKLLFNYNIGVGLSIPIFSAARPNYQTKIAKINLQAHDYALQTQRVSLNNNILQTKSDIASIEQQLANYKLQITQANEALSLASSRYANGVITNLEFLTAQTNLQDALLGETQLEYNLLLSKLALNRLGSVKFW